MSIYDVRARATEGAPLPEPSVTRQLAFGTDSIDETAKAADASCCGCCCHSCRKACVGKWIALALLIVLMFGLVLAKVNYARHRWMTQVIDVAGAQGNGAGVPHGAAVLGAVGCQPRQPHQR